MMTAAVRPATDTPEPPQQYIPLFATFDAAVSIWLLPMPGSPTTRQLMLPLVGIHPSSSNFLLTPPNSASTMPALTSSWP